MRTARRAALRIMNVTIAAAVAVPAALFTYSAWLSYRAAWRDADERIERLLDVVHEHALKVFESVDLVFLYVERIAGNRLDDDLRADQSRLHAELKQLVVAVGPINSIWMFDRRGDVVATSLLSTRPFNARDRDYFVAQVERDAGTFIGDVLAPRATSRAPFIGVSRRLPSPDGSFNGVAQVSVLPMKFEEFYARVGGQPAAALSMLRTDGVMLARFPKVPGPSRPLTEESGFRRLIAADELGGRYTAVSQVDGAERHFGVRKLSRYPIYLAVGIDTATIHQEWLSMLGSQSLFGLPATALLCLTLLIARRRTETLYDEAEGRQAAEAALRQAQRMEAIGQLTGGVAHDFNNLLMVVVGGVRMLQKRPHEPHQVRFFDMIATAAKRGEALTRQLLTFARRQTLAPEVIDLRERMPALRELLRRSLRGDIDVHIELSDAPCRVEADPGELELALINLAVNARDAMPQAGTLTFRVAPIELAGAAATDRLHGRFVAISVTDTGQGIPPEVLSRVFEPFFTTKAIGKGTGLGLSQVYGFAKQSGGTATIASTPGQGTVVTMYLPGTDKAVSGDQTVESAGPVSGAGRMVLIVEDNPEVAEVCRSYLEQLGFRTEHAGSADQAMERLRPGAPFDLVVSDILMPGEMNGVDLARQLQRARPGLPIILATGYSNSAEQASREGFAVLRKPYDLEAIQRAIRVVLPATWQGASRHHAPSASRITDR